MTPVIPAERGNDGVLKIAGAASAAISAGTVRYQADAVGNRIGVMIVVC